MTMSLKIFFTLPALFQIMYGNAQKTQIGLEYGRAYFFYNYKDDGTGFINETKSNYNFIAGIVVSRQINHNWSAESGIKFSMFQQYFSTKKYWGAFESAYPVLLLPLNMKYETKGKAALILLGGATIGLHPEQYIGSFRSRFYNIETMTYDSITRGTYNREYGMLFPLLNLGVGFKYDISPSLNAELKINYAKGLKKITEFDIYYNNGSGSNDQHARQWGYGDFASLTLAVKYKFRSKSKSD